MINKILKIMKKNNEIITPSQLEKKEYQEYIYQGWKEKGLLKKLIEEYM